MLPPRLTLLLATGLGLGRSPIAPGTVGGLLGLPLTWGLLLLHSNGAYWGVTILFCLLAVPIADRAAKLLGGKKDPGTIVIDEIVSMPITFALIPAQHLDLTSGSLLVWILGFLLNRAFDITKPPPARQLEQLPGGLGIMADDWAAGAYSAMVLWAVVWLLG